MLKINQGHTVVVEGAVIKTNIWGVGQQKLFYHSTTPKCFCHSTSKMFYNLIPCQKFATHPLLKICLPPPKFFATPPPKFFLPHHFPYIFATSSHPPHQILPPHPKKVPFLLPKYFAMLPPKFLSPHPKFFDTQPPNTLPCHSHNFFCYLTSKIFAILPPPQFFSAPLLPPTSATIVCP